MGQSNLNAWLVRKSGRLAGTRDPVRDDITRVGRSSENDVIITDAAVVSGHHLEIHKNGEVYYLRDLNSTNGTYLNGQRVTEAALDPPCVIRLGADGPELTFLVDEAPALHLDQTLVASANPFEALAPPSKEKAPEPASGVHADLLSEAVERARKARRAGIGDSTVVIMREMLDAALHRTGRKFKAVIAALVLALAGVTGYGFWKIQGMKQEKRGFDTRIEQIEAVLAKANQESPETDQLISQLDQYSDEALALQNKLLYRVGSFEHEEFLKHEIRALMAEFGAETYSIPPEFLEEVKRFIDQYEGPDRPHIERALGEERKNMDAMRAIFDENSLPADLVFIPLVESALSGESASAAGAVGLWQFTPITAKAYGLKVAGGVDERLNVTKETRAACKYIRELILDFGAGSSVMLALAAYNLGPSKVKNAIHKVTDPIKQRNFWYLYRVRAVPPETREYVPKVIAAMIIGRHPERYGF
ncbi:MAG TPA: transglycosylase SLT domain-containing protein [Bryobacteraceae bacterium]|nr:transglycosylase SLT domain-containing protein [Bryobacteraceae bacterium]